MKLNFEIVPRVLEFKFDAGTSRGVLKTRQIWWVKTWDLQAPDRVGWGEAAPLVQLSVDDRPDFEVRLGEVLAKAARQDWSGNEADVLARIKDLVPQNLPAARFALEMAVLDWKNAGEKRFFRNAFRDASDAIAINGLIWMGAKEFMFSQIKEKLAAGFTCIKMKIGAIDFEQELELLRYIRQQFSPDEITLRVDANGAFKPDEALDKLKQLSELGIHSIEQPIRAAQRDEMAELCVKSPLPIALDEELIGVADKTSLLNHINPQHIILKPSLLGGFSESQEWISLAESKKIGWWVTSALESNVGLNAIAQLASKYQPVIPQGLGTGQLYHNNLASPLQISKGSLIYNQAANWEEPA
ncbi:o-succinylbenzoate synthase [Algoriphagus vanfongensis]|uniref:o-succinylbenzoate synthase n=1 Tax=Algoriphagus vanfongensis TaxID=426371 RepID=UPI0003FF9DCE|nr:o-succinylbenzoate synthase [Algoriphagus vanfongensis]